ALSIELFQLVAPADLLLEIADAAIQLSADLCLIRDHAIDPGLLEQELLVEQVLELIAGNGIGNRFTALSGLFQAACQVTVQYDPPCDVTDNTIDIAARRRRLLLARLGLGRHCNAPSDNAEQKGDRFMEIVHPCWPRHWYRVLRACVPQA